MNSARRVPTSRRPRKSTASTPEPQHLALARYAARDLVELDRQIAAHGAPADLAATYERLIALGRRLHAGTVPAPLWGHACDIHSSLMRSIERWQSYRAPDATVIRVDFKAGRRAS